MSSGVRGGKYLETAHVSEKDRVKRGIGSKFPELGAIQPERDDCAPPLIVCGRCAVCHRSAAQRLAGLAVASTAFQQEGGPDAEHVDRVGALRTSLLALGILTEDDEKDPDTGVEEMAA